MPEQNQKLFGDERMRRRAFSRWENEGGATVTGREKHHAKTLHTYTVVYKKKPRLETLKGSVNMRIVKYDEKDKNSGSTEEHVATDEAMDKKFGNIQNAYEEGFASADGVRSGTAESDGRVKHPEKGDDTTPKRTPDFIEDENPGLADN